jgi:alkanesulfonate monooxygenase SsuD/methylene tetrahydromethanopterin reductase-like flavin-dependent oxidoreductase (luciferase family)
MMPGWEVTAVDYGRPVEFGFFPEPAAEGVERLFELVALAEREGLDLVGIQDHPYQWRYLDTWALLANLAARTSRIRLFPDVSNLPLRPPAMLAKAAASIDVLSGGRFEVGLGAGAFWDAIEAMGGPRRAPGEAVEALEDAIAIMRLMWSGQRSVRHDGRHYRVHGLHPGAPPPHPIELWVGASGPRMLRLIGRAADGWLPSSPSVPPERLAACHAVIDEAAAAAGREPTAVRRLYNVSGRIAARPGGFLDGPAGQWAEQLAELVLERGMDTFILSAAEPAEEQLRRFAVEVVPAVRETVATARGR